MRRSRLLSAGRELQNKPKRHVDKEGLTDGIQELDEGSDKRRGSAFCTSFGAAAAAEIHNLHRPCTPLSPVAGQNPRQSHRSVGRHRASPGFATSGLLALAYTSDYATLLVESALLICLCEVQLGLVDILLR